MGDGCEKWVILHVQGVPDNTRLYYAVHAQALE
jgi:hypothetical protein